MSWRDWFFFGGAPVAGPTTLYWKGATTDWFTASNWSQSSGGPADGWVPRAIDSVIFDAGGVGNCTLTADVEITSFILNADLYTGTMNWANFNMLCHGTFRYNAASSSTTRWSNVGNLTMDASGLLQQSCLETHPKIVTLKAGIFIQNSSQYWFHCKKFIAEANVSLQNLRIGPRLPTDTVDIIDLHSTVTCGSGMEFRFYLTSSTSVTQKGMNYPNVGMYINYCEYTTMTMTGNLTLNWLVIHGSLFSNTEAEAPVLDMAGYNLTTTLDVQLGLSTTSGYFGKIKLGTGTHSIGTDFKGHGPLTWAYVDFGSCNISIGRDLDLRYATIVGSNTSTITLNTSANANIYAGSNALNNVVITKTSATVTFPTTFSSVYLLLTTGTLDLSDNAVTHTVSEDATFNGGTLDLGNSTLSVGGNFDNRNLSTFTPATGKIRMTGYDKLFYSINDTPTTRRYYNLDFASGCYIRLKGVNTVRALNRVDIAGRVHCEDVTFDVYNTATVYFTATGRVSGGVFSVTDCATNCGIVQFPTGAVIDSSYLTFNCGWGGICSFPPGTYGAAQVEIRDTSSNSSPHTVELKSGSYIFTGHFVFSQSNPNGPLSMRNDVNNPSIEVRGNFTTTKTAGSLQWVYGTGTITFSGGANQTVTISSALGSVDHVNVNKSANTLTFATSLTCRNFTHTTGSVTFGAFGYFTQDVTFSSGGTGTITFNVSTTLIIAGNYSTLGTTVTWTFSDTTTWTFTGTGKTITFGVGPYNRMGTVNIFGTYTLTGVNNAYVFYSTDIRPGATLTLQDSYWVSENLLSISGTVSGNTFNGRLYWYPTLNTDYCHFYSSAILDCYSFYVRPMAAGITPRITFESGSTIACVTAFYFWTGAEAFNRNVQIEGYPIFNCDVTMYCQSTADFTVDFTAYYTPEIRFKGDLTKIYNSTGKFYFVLNGGVQTIIEGNADQYFDADGNTFSDFAIQKFGGGRFTVAPKGFTTRAWGLLVGDCDIRGAVIKTEGFQLSGQWGDARFWNGIDNDMDNARIEYNSWLYIQGSVSHQVFITNLDFVSTNAAPTNWVEYTTVTNSQHTGLGPDIDATLHDGNIDGGGNLGWFFGYVAFAAHFHSILGQTSYFYPLLGTSRKRYQLQGKRRLLGLTGTSRKQYDLFGSPEHITLQHTD